MNYSSFVFENNDGIATVRLNDPEKLNALTFQTYGDLEKIMAELAGRQKRESRRVDRNRERLLFRRQRQRHHRPAAQDERRRALQVHAHDL